MLETVLDTTIDVYLLFVVVREFAKKNLEWGFPKNEVGELTIFTQKNWGIDELGYVWERYRRYDLFWGGGNICFLPILSVGGDL